MSPKEISEILAFDRSKISIHRLILKLEKDGFDFQAFFDQLPSIEFPTRWYMTWMLTHYVERNTEERTAHQDLIWRRTEGMRQSKHAARFMENHVID